MTIQLALAIWLACGFASAYFAKRDKVMAFFGGLLLPLMALAALWVFGTAFGVVWFAAQ